MEGSKSVFRGHAVDSAAGHVAPKSEGAIRIAVDQTPTRVFQGQCGRKPSLHTPKRPENLPENKLAPPVPHGECAVT